jgi:DNA-binding NtrC family response regulator
MDSPSEKSHAVHAPPPVLIVEDEPRMRDLLARAVAGWGFPVSAARSSEEALRSMDANPAHVVVLDLNLPGAGGMECFQAIRARRPSTQVIILTGFGDLDAARKAIELNVVAFLTKPCHLGELESALDRARKRLIEAGERELERMPIPPEPAAESAPPPDPSDKPGTLQDVERQHILAALSRHNGNRAATAAELGISLRTLYYRLTEYQKKGYLDG